MALLVPQVAIGSSQLGRYVYVVGAGNKVEQRLVTTGATDGDLVVISKGLAEGDSVIVGNLQKIGAEIYQTFLSQQLRRKVGPRASRQSVPNL